MLLLHSLSPSVSQTQTIYHLLAVTICIHSLLRLCGVCRVCTYRPIARDVTIIYESTLFTALLRLTLAPQCARLV